MAVYCPQHDLLFIGNKRTASTAIGRALVEHCGGHYVPETRVIRDGEVVSKRHCTVPQLVKFAYLDRPVDDLLKFVAVRNPFDSLVSMWVKRRHRRRYAQSRTARDALEFDAFLLDHVGEDRSPRSMHAAFVEGVDEVIRYERLGDDLRAVLDKSGAPPFDLPVVNPTKEKAGSYRDYYSPESRALVELVFADDLDRFGYGF